MPNLSIVIPEVNESVLRPVVFDIVRQLEEITKIPKDTVILFPGQLDRTYQPGSAVGDKGQDRTQFLNNNIVQIEVDEDFSKESVLATAVTRIEHLNVFCDDKIGVVIKPVYATTSITINFKFRSKSKTQITRWRDDIRMRTSMMRDINLHQIHYHYNLPIGYIDILKEIHRLRESIAGYGEDFATYLVNNATTRLTELSNLSGAKTELGIAETQMRIVGYFDFESFPDKPERDEESETWVGTFAYKFAYEKPIACNMTYPVMIHNQILSTKFRPAEEAYNIDNHAQSFSLSNNAFNFFEAQLQVDKYINTQAVITIPSFDEFIPSSIPTGTVSIFNALCQLSVLDCKSLLNLKELDIISIDSDIMEFITKSEWPYMAKLYRSILQVNLYKGLDLASNGSIELDAALNVSSMTNLDIRINNRVRFSIVADISLLDQNALNRLKKFPKALVKIIAAVNEGLRNNPGFIDLSKKSYINKDDIYNFITDPSINNYRIQNNTVMQSYVVALENIK